MKKRTRTSRVSPHSFSLKRSGLGETIRSHLSLSRLSKMELSTTELSTWLKGGGVILFGVVLVGATLVTSSSPPRLDDFGCLEDSLPPEHVVMLFDVTDKIAGVDKLNTRLEELSHTLPPYSRITVYLLSPEQGDRVTEQLSSNCRPKHPDDINPLTGNRRQAETSYAAFTTEFADLITEEILYTPPASTSPLIEALLEIGQEQTAMSRLVFVSDGLHHQPSEVSMYQPGYSFAAAKHLRCVAALEGVLTDVTVDFWVLERPQSAWRQNANFDRFWSEAFEWAGVQNITTTTLKEVSNG